MPKSRDHFSPDFRRRQSLTLGATAAIPLGCSLYRTRAVKPAQLIVATGGGKLDDAYKASVFKTFTEKTGIPISHDRQSRGQTEGHG